MFLVSLLLVSLIVIAVVMEKKYLTVEQEELIPIPVRVNESGSSRRLC